MTPEKRAYRELWVYMRRRQGYCSRCNGRKAVEGYSACQECREADRKRAKRVTS